ncbi:GWxTD domain-containing protein [bacterium]|nr:GWxTD domain-containing protein [bacterium]
MTSLFIFVLALVPHAPSQGFALNIPAELVARISEGRFQNKGTAVFQPWNLRSEETSFTRRFVTSTRDYYLEGNEKRKAGDWEKALEIWAEGQKHLQARNESDARISFSFIELATEKAERIYYAFASRTWYWGLSHDSGELEAELQKEITRMSPLLGKQESSNWQSLLSQDRRSLLTEMKRYWIERDPTPTTILNERLIEHWERIAFARENFTQGKNSVYGTDDRGLIYVKYGDPDQALQVTLGVDSGEIQNMAAWHNIGAMQLGEFRRGIESFLTYPECEVWSYHSLNEQEPTVFVFGEVDGVFGLKSGVEEFIPDRAFRTTSSRYTAGVVPGAVIQMMYYNRLSAFDLSFASRRDELEQEFSRDSKVFTNSSQVRGLRNKFKILDEHSPSRRHAPLEYFDPARFISPIHLWAARLRFLDDQNNPKLVFVASTVSQKPTTDSRDEMNGGDLLLDLEYTLLARKSNMDVITRFRTSPIEGSQNTAFFKLSHDPEHEHYTLVARSKEMILQSPDRRPKVGNLYFDKLEPLSTDRERLEVSDLVIGVDPPEDRDKGFLPFPLVPTHKMSSEDVLRVYIEVYHLKLNDAGIGRFSLESRIVRLKKNKGTYERQELIATSFDFDSESRTSREDFGVSIANYEAGNYEIEIEVLDRVSGEKRKRSSQFEILD